MKQISTRYALILCLIVGTVLHSPVIEAQQKMYFTDEGTDKIQRADLDGSNVEDLVTTGLTLPRSIALDVSDIPPPVSIDIKEKLTTTWGRIKSQR